MSKNYKETNTKGFFWKHVDSYKPLISKEHYSTKEDKYYDTEFLYLVQLENKDILIAKFYQDDEHGIPVWKDYNYPHLEILDTIEYFLRLDDIKPKEN